MNNRSRPSEPPGVGGLWDWEEDEGSPPHFGGSRVWLPESRAVLDIESGVR